MPTGVIIIAALPTVLAAFIARGAPFTARTPNPNIAAPFNKPLITPPLGLLPLAFAILSIRSTIIPFASVINPRDFCRDTCNPPRPLAKFCRELNPPENIEPKNCFGSN